MNPEIIDMSIFSQILEMDEDEDDRSFSRELIVNYYQQAIDTFQKMDTALAGSDLPSLSNLGHFLKGSSSSLGIRKVREICEQIQHIGNLKEGNGTGEISPADALGRLPGLVDSAKRAFIEAKEYLNSIYLIQM
ncbi:putative histidine phosphotransferase HPT1p [Anaeromyces robustus]|jgi:osomolarity two-component system phosphorelay intermediate protein YPD1|uniref:Putative histidine phosphotransferase HPT1p n=1 Tax=Anaeromyces robustus TaxID=1754192 RepID=A0A1Y1XBR9_9FUNG|nr:putative histidine phosphotransferase HPT1p [Anaeromyces robustus]|eukprot:ORX83163.1 putative histidine phosphotransferase HPT1p [Anaeromyces robustus]